LQHHRNKLLKVSVRSKPPDSCHVWVQVPPVPEGQSIALHLSLNDLIKKGISGAFGVRKERTEAAHLRAT